MAKKTVHMILIIEDEEILLRVLYLTFHNAAYRIASATDGETGLKMVERLKPDIILLDLILPKLSGFDILKTIKANEALKHIPVIVLSNLGDEQDIEKAKQLGAEDYFVKANTDLNVLLQKVNATVKNHESRMAQPRPRADE